MPVCTSGDHLFRVISDGVVLCKLLNAAVQDTIDERAINLPANGTSYDGSIAHQYHNYAGYAAPHMQLSIHATCTGKKLNAFEGAENLHLAINSARSLGLSTVNVHASDLARAADDHKEHLVCGLMWQIVRLALLSKITLKEHPQIVSALQPCVSFALYIPHRPPLHIQHNLRICPHAPTVPTASSVRGHELAAQLATR